MPSLYELITIAIIIGILSYTGIWPEVIRGIRQLRGERLDEGAPAPASARDLDLAYKMLGISPSAPWPDVEKAYRAKAKLHHPDHGGDDDVMRALNDAYAAIRRTRKRVG